MGWHLRPIPDARAPVPADAAEVARLQRSLHEERAKVARLRRDLDAEIDKATAIRGALGCRDGETALGVARRYPLEVDRLIADNVALSGERAQLAKERDAYHATARANGEQRDRFAADLGRLLVAIERFADTRIAWGPRMDAVLAEAQRIRDGGALPVDPRDAEIAGLRDALDAGAARAASLVARAEAERDALVAAGVALRKAGLIAGAAQWARFLALLPAETLTFWGPAEDMWS